MKLIDLNPEFFTMPKRDSKDNLWTYCKFDKGPEGAGGISFDCPQCSLHLNSKGIYHWDELSIIPHILYLYVPEAFEADPMIGPGRWNLVGNNFEDLSLINGSSSVLCSYGCYAHFFVRNGGIEMCSDSGTVRG